jgi:putative ABC transport system permease protein
VRAALGGSRLRIVRQVLLESGVLAVVGAAFGVGLAVLGIEVLLALQPGGLPRIDTVRVDTAVLAFTVSAALLSALLFGVLPAVQASRPDLARSLRDRGGTGGARAQALVRGTVVVLEVSLSLVLLIGAGLMLRSFGALRAVDPGFDAEGVLTFGVSLPNARYGSPTARAAFAAQFRERLNALPGVQVASAALPLPLAGETFNGPYGTLAARGNAELFRQADIRVVHPGYFETLRTRVLEGRAFSEADQADSTAVVVVDGVLARRAWPGESALGKRILVRFFSIEHVEAEVIGVVEHQRNGSLAVEGRETVYWPDRFAGSPGNMTWLVRGTGDPARHLAAARAELAALDPLLPLSDVRPLTDLVDRAQAATRFTLVLLVIFGLTALILAVVGLYGVLSYTVRQRTSEIGLRMAFGADAGAILGMVLQQGLRLTALGVVLGVAAALALTRVLESMLVGVEPTDAPTFAATVALFGAVATLACWLPARRATRVSPLVALQEP